MPELAEGTVIRADIPVANQPHPEMNIAGVAQEVPELTIAFAQAKRQAQYQGQDLGGYQTWRRNQLMTEVNLTHDHSLCGSCDSVTQNEAINRDAEIRTGAVEQGVSESLR